MRDEVIAELEHAGLLRKEQAAFRTTRRWQAAMARAALRLYRAEGTRDDDLRIPIVCALLDVYGPDLTREQLAELTEVMHPIEAAELDPRAHLERAARAAESRDRPPRDPRVDGTASKKP